MMRIFVVLIGMVVVFCALPCRAEWRLLAEEDYNFSDVSIEDKVTGERTDSQNQLIEQRYSLYVNRQMLPTIKTFGGISYQRAYSKAESDNGDFSSTRETLRPNAGLAYSNGIFAGGVDYDGLRIREDSSSTESTERLKDDIGFRFSVRPEELPSLSARYHLTYLRDDPRTFETRQRSLNLSTLYDLRTVRLRYSYNRDEDEAVDREIETTRQNHNANMEWQQSFLERTLSLLGSYRFGYTKTETESPSDVQPEVELPPSGGLSAVTTAFGAEEAVLESNPVLIDGNFVVSAGINLGLNADETQLANIGVGFDAATFTVSEIRVSVDREDLANTSIPAAFRWDVYVSDDNTALGRWRLHASSLQATFTSLENPRFEIPFAPVRARFIKVVVRSLSDPTLPGVISFGDILVTEIEAIGRFSDQAGGTPDFESTSHGVDFTAAYLFSSRTRGNYDFSLLHSSSEPTGRNRTYLSNNFRLSHLFSPIYSGSVRFGRSDEFQSGAEDEYTYNYGATLAAMYLPTFRQTLSFSGNYFSTEDGVSTRNTLTLGNIMALYPGVDVSVDIGYSVIEEFDDRLTGNLITRLSTDLRPNRKLGFHFDYSARHTDLFEEGGDGSEDIMNIRSSSNFNAQVYYNPTPTLSFFAGYTVDESGGRTARFRRFAVNWAPWPGAPLEVRIPYSETYSSAEDETTRSIGPDIRWRISRHFILETRYTFARRENNFENIKSHNIYGNLKMVF